MLCINVQFFTRLKHSFLFGAIFKCSESKACFTCPHQRVPVTAAPNAIQPAVCPSKNLKPFVALSQNI